jgi:hypothetical protein
MESWRLIISLEYVIVEQLFQWSPRTMFSMTDKIRKSMHTQNSQIKLVYNPEPSLGNKDMTKEKKRANWLNLLFTEAYINSVLN